MPERVTREERTISLAIEKARDAKEKLYQSLENNRLPEKDDSEHVKVKRPKAENVDVEIKPDGKHSGLGLDSSSYAGEETHFKKEDTFNFTDEDNAKFFRENTFTEEDEIWSDNSRIRDFRNIKAEMKAAINKTIRSVAKKHDLTVKETNDMIKELFRLK